MRLDKLNGQTTDLFYCVDYWVLLELESQVQQHNSQVAMVIVDRQIKINLHFGKYNNFGI